ncbi:MAG TPA: cupin domain-containing protein [Burkholderiales bacterium]
MTDFSKAKYDTVAPGCRRTSLTGGAASEMTAELLQLSPSAKLVQRVPEGADQYFYVLAGGVSLRANGGEAKGVAQNSFALCQEGTSVEIAAEPGHETQLISVVAPPRGKSDRRGFTGGLAVLPVSAQPVVDVPEQKKKRIYLATKDVGSTERAHGMIVVYQADTVTGNHMHPNAESLFVFLEGRAVVTVNGEEVSVGRGQTTFYGTHDKHRLRGADDGVRFLEFHIPGAYTTVRD